MASVDVRRLSLIAVVAFRVTIGFGLHHYVELYMDSHDAAKLVEIRHAGVRLATVKKLEWMYICISSLTQMQSQGCLINLPDGVYILDVRTLLQIYR
jgi:hypothetical protein